MADQILDMDGWPIVPDARVYVPARTVQGLTATVPAFGGIVLSATPDVVEVEELESFNRRSVRPADCRVQSGETQTSLKHRAIREGGTAYMRQRAARIQLREERARRKAEAEQGETD